MPKRKQKIHKKDDWATFALGYIHLAQLACEELIEKKYENEEYVAESIYLPAIYNLKHGIEILLKSFSIEFLKKESIDSSDFSHDIDEIFSRLKREVPERRLRVAIEKWEKENTDQKGKLTGSAIYEELERIVKKYHHLEFLKNKIGADYVISDFDNTALKYPSNSLSMQIDYGELTKRFDKIDFERTLHDCLKLETIFWKLFLLLYAERR